MKENLPTHRQHIERLGVLKRRAFLGEPTVAQVSAFMIGFNAATGYTLFRGFREWLAIRLGGGYEFHWVALLERVANGVTFPYGDYDTSEDIGAVVDKMFEIVVEFLGDAADPQRLQEMYRRYDELRIAAGIGLE